MGSCCKNQSRGNPIDNIVKLSESRILRNLITKKLTNFLKKAKFCPYHLVLIWTHQKFYGEQGTHFSMHPLTPCLTKEKTTPFTYPIGELILPSHAFLITVCKCGTDYHRKYDHPHLLTHSKEGIRNTY